MDGGIYEILCTKNNSFYIGRTINFEKRKNDHLRDLRTGKHKNSRLQNCFSKYGESSFVFELKIPLSDDKQTQVKREQELIDARIDDINCLNINRSAETFCDVPWTEERKQKIRAAAIGRKLPPATEKRKRLISSRLMGHAISAETRRKISLARKGKHLSDEHKEKLKEAFSGQNNPMYGMVGAKNPQSKTVLQINACTGAIIAEFGSVAEAGRKLGCDKSSIAKVCRGKLTTTKGYVWRYK